MAIHRGFQSAVFYYLSCAPCAEARVRKQRKQEAKWDRADRELLEAQMPNLYRHPSPSSTNPHWQTDIDLGPTPVSRGGKKKKKAAGSGSESQRGLKSSATQSNQGSGFPSSVDLSRLGSLEKQDEQGWRQYQREDEELWGSGVMEKNHLDGDFVKNGPAKPPKARTTNSDTYRTYRNPAVNDLHPAIVTRVSSPNDVAWMLQPPPVAEVMSGKQAPVRSRSGSGSTRPSASIGSPHLSAQSSGRTKDRRLRSRGSSAAGLSREVSLKTANGATGQRHDREGMKITTEDRDFAEPLVRREKQRPPPIGISTRDSEDSAVTVIRNAPSATEVFAPGGPQSRKVASRPNLSTIMSDNTLPSENDGEFRTAPATPENSPPLTARNSSEHPRDKGATSNHDVTLKAMQDKRPRQTKLNTKIFATSPALVDSGIRLPRQDEDEDRRLSGGPELFDSWYTPDFELDKWVHEHTKREVTGRKRWSMDI